ncbi:AAA family ATPase [Sphingobacterium thalpophilum]|uniref:AAA family ATPase n=1 Tax=Sphingobacterium thalpophilum TaxID=259 RepID=UPI003D984DC3
MRLEFVYIKKYRSIEQQSFDLSNEFIFDFNVDKNLVSIDYNSLYIEDFFGKNINAFTGIIGENGSGKSTFLNYIKEVLSMPKSYNEDNQCLLIFFQKNTEKDELLIIDNLNNNKKIEVKASDRLKSIVKITKLADLNEDLSEEGVSNFDKKFTVLESIPGLEELAVFHLSTIFEPFRMEVDYFARRKPYVYNYSTNYIFKKSQNEGKRTYNSSEAKRILSFIVNASKFGPKMTLPDSIDLVVNEFKLQNFLAEETSSSSPSRKNILNNNFISLFQSGQLMFKDIRSRIRFVLHLNILIEIFPFFDNENELNRFMDELSNSDIESFEQSLLDNLDEKKEFLGNRMRNSNWSLPENFWDSYSENHNKLIKLTLAFFDARKESSNLYPNYIKVALSKENYGELKNLIDLIDLTNIVDSAIINFSWPNVSSGELSMLSIFGRLFSFHQEISYLQIRPQILWFLLDECENTFHPQWAKQFNSLLIEFILSYFDEYQCQVIFTSHSAFTISDLPKKNLVFLKKDDDKTIVQKSLNDHKQTFAANINILYSDSFFIQNGLIGDWANKKLNEVIELLYENSLSGIMDKRDYIEKVINIVGEPIIKNRLLSLLEDKLRANLLSIKQDIEDIKRINNLS